MAHKDQLIDTCQHRKKMTTKGSIIRFVSTWQKLTKKGSIIKLLPIL